MYYTFVRLSYTSGCLSSTLAGLSYTFDCAMLRSLNAHHTNLRHFLWESWQAWHPLAKACMVLVFHRNTLGSIAHVARLS